MKLIHESYLAYLTPKAMVAIELLKKIGLDSDLAVSVLEVLWREQDVYELEESKDARQGAFEP